MQDMIATKFDPPAWMGGQIRRDHLLELLDLALTLRLTLIHAPAGYGKTSLLAQWRARLDPAAVQVAWLTLERDDRDLKRLIEYLSSAVQGAGADPRGRALTADLPPRAALSAITSELARSRQPFVLILDDLHHANSDEVGAFLQSLIRLAPSNCHFVFASRDYPWLGQSVLAAEEQLLEISAKELRFSHGEAESVLARGNAPLNDADIDLILDRTEGWPIAVQLTSLSIKRGVGQQQVMDQLSGSNTDLARYLSEQVLMTLPADMREVASRTAILDRLSGELVDLLCDRQDGWLVLEKLEQQGVFLTAVSQDRREYRYHQLFAEYLRDRFERSDRARFLELQCRAAAWFAERGLVALAVKHAIIAGEHELLAGILENAGGWRLIPEGQQSVVERALARIPGELIRSRPRLALAQVYLQLKRGEFGVARAEFDLFWAKVADTELSADLRTEIRVVGDTLADYENQPVSLDDLIAREALLRKLPSNDHLVMANINETLGAKYFEGGWLERALQPTLAAREHYQAFGSIYSEVFTRFLEARIKRAQGRSKESEAILQAAWNTIVAHFGEWSDLAANCAAFQAELLYERDGVADARRLLAWALPHMEYSDGWVDVYAAAYFTEARALAGAGYLEEAFAIVARARRTASRRRLRQLELLADICDIDIRIANDAPLDEILAASENFDLGSLADAMAQDSPQYRPVAVAASLCRVKLRLMAGDHRAAMAELDRLGDWANHRGAGRLLVDINLLKAFGHRAGGSIEPSKACFDESVGIAMFQDILTPFVEARQFVQKCLDEALHNGTEIDRFRAQFLKSIHKAIAAGKGKVSVQGPLSPAELEVVFYLRQGRSNKEIARLIGMSPDTVKYRLKSLFRKIGVSKRRDAVRVSAERGLVPDLAAQLDAQAQNESA